MQVVEREEGSPPPPFDNAMLQRTLRSDLIGILEVFRVEKAVQMLRSQSFIGAPGG